MFKLRNPGRAMTYADICHEAERVHEYAIPEKDVITIVGGTLFTWHSLVGALYHRPDRLFVRDVGNEWYEISYEELVTAIQSE